MQNIKWHIMLIPPPERFPGACIASLHCVRKCSSSLTDESCRPCCVSCTSRSRKLVYPNSTSSRQSEKSSSRLCREFWAMSLSSSSMWTVSLQNAKTKTISDDYSFLLHGALFSQRVGGEPHLAQEIDELNFGQAIWQDTGNGSNTRPEQINLWFSLTPDRERRDELCKSKQ